MTMFKAKGPHGHQIYFHADMYAMCKMRLSPENHPVHRRRASVCGCFHRFVTEKKMQWLSLADNII